MNYHGIKYKGNDSLEQLLIKLYTFYRKYIVPKKRTVYLAVELSTKLSSLPVTTQKSVKKLSEWITDGVDINGSQSSGLYGQGSRDYQNMLYGVVHLHLSADENDVHPIIKKDRFAKRGKYLLFALFKTDAAYFIDIQPHPSALTSNNTSATEWTIVRKKYLTITLDIKMQPTAAVLQAMNQLSASCSRFA